MANHQQCVQFLQWALPHMHMRWAGFRKVHNQVCKRLQRRVKSLNLHDVDEYQQYLTRHDEEWRFLDQCCRITNSRFYRDKHVFNTIGQDILPELARRTAENPNPVLDCWSIGCAGGEEAYTLSVIWELLVKNRFPTVAFQVLATDSDPHQLQRATKACYSKGALKDLPAPWIEQIFVKKDTEYCLQANYKNNVRYMEQDIRIQTPCKKFDIVFCRNLVFTYFDPTLQQSLLNRVQDHLNQNGILVIGAHEKLPSHSAIIPFFDNLNIFQKQQRGE